MFLNHVTPSHLFFISHHFCFKYKMRCKRPFFPLFNRLFDLPTDKPFLRKSCHPSFTLSSILARGLPGGLFPGLLPSMINGTWSQCSRVWPSQTLWQIRWPSPHRHASILLRYSLRQTKLGLKPVSKVTSHSSAAFARPLSLMSIIRLHSEKYARWQSLYSLLQARASALKAFVRQQFFFS